MERKIDKYVFGVASNYIAQREEQLEKMSLSYSISSYKNFKNFNKNTESFVAYVERELELINNFERSLPVKYDIFGIRNYKEKLSEELTFQNYILNEA